VDGVVSLYMNDASTHPSSPVNAAQSSSASPPQSPPPPPEIGIRRSSRARKELVKYSPSFSKNKNEIFLALFKYILTMFSIICCVESQGTRSKVQRHFRYL
jgi:hypothetical protein